MDAMEEYRKRLEDNSSRILSGLVAYVRLTELNTQEYERLLDILPRVAVALAKKVIDKVDTEIAFHGPNV